MQYAVERFDAREWPEQQLESLFAEGFPAFITADQEVKKYIARIRTSFPQLNVMLLDEGGTAVATGWAVPIAWSDEVEDLPTSFSDVLRRALESHDSGYKATTLVICAGVVHPDRKGTGAARQLLEALIAAGQNCDLTRVVAPVRPTRKHVYPLFSITDYAAWVRPDGLPFDPWLRLHVRSGARIIALLPAAQTMTGTVKEWEDWAGMSLPASGEYIIPQGMSPLSINLAANTGTYVEPNIWVQHR